MTVFAFLVRITARRLSTFAASKQFPRASVIIDEQHSVPVSKPSVGRQWIHLVAALAIAIAHLVQNLDRHVEFTDKPTSVSREQQVDAADVLADVQPVVSSVGEQQRTDVDDHHGSIRSRGPTADDSTSGEESRRSDAYEFRSDNTRIE